MRLEVVEAPDHSACMEQLRNRHGADCVVVHSFRVDDRYRVVVALETESPQSAGPAESAVKNVVSSSRTRWDTIVDKAPAADDVQISESPVTENLPSQEAFHQPSALEPESEDFRAAVFSDVLANAVTQRVTELASQDQVTPVENSTLGNFPAQTSMTISRFPVPVNALVNRVEPTLSGTLDEADWAEEAPVPRVCTSKGAEGFASLLMECVADSQKSLPLSGQTQLRMVGGHNIF